MDLGWLARLVAQGPGETSGFPKDYLVRLGAGSLLALVLAFLVPIALVDDSSHYRRAWWIAWFWPIIMLLMLSGDALVVGFGAMKLKALLSPKV